MGVRDAYEKLSPWAVDLETNHTMRIYKCHTLLLRSPACLSLKASLARQADAVFCCRFLVYLDSKLLDDVQDATPALSVKPGSHLSEVWNSTIVEQIVPACNERHGCDVIMIDQRILHKGEFELIRHEPHDRIVVTIGMGPESQHTREFMAGTKARAQEITAKASLLPPYPWRSERMRAEEMRR